MKTSGREGLQRKKKAKRIENETVKKKGKEEEKEEIKLRRDGGKWCRWRRKHGGKVR